MMERSKPQWLLELSVHICGGMMGTILILVLFIALKNGWLFDALLYGSNNVDDTQEVRVLQYLGEDGNWVDVEEEHE